jgi:hypothetical protein
VVETPKAAFLVSGDGERRKTMSAEFVQETHFAVGVTKRNEILTKQADSNGSAIPLELF